jgi:hypothetical protein
MALEVTYYNQDFPDGKPFAIAGLGSFPNGETVELTKEQEETFLAVKGKTVREALGKSANVTIKGHATTSR